MKTYMLHCLPKGYRRGTHNSPGTYGWPRNNAGWWVIRESDGAAIAVEERDEYSAGELREACDAANDRAELDAAVLRSLGQASF